MLGVLECVDGVDDGDGKTVVLRAFSGQFNTCWLAEGWVPPMFALNKYYHLLPKTESMVQQMTGDIESCTQKAEQCKLQFEQAMASGGRGEQKDCRRQMQESFKALELSKKTGEHIPSL